jgi:hypothetical protein
LSQIDGTNRDEVVKTVLKNSGNRVIANKKLFSSSPPSVPLFCNLHRKVHVVKVSLWNSSIQDYIGVA